MNKFLLSASLAIVTLTSAAQHSAFNCSAHEYYTRLYETSPEFRANQQKLEEETRSREKSNVTAKAMTATYIIPVVFHVIHTGGTGNISDAQIINQVNILNKEFTRTQADTALTPAAFKSSAAPFSVEFRLATIDPNGDCTNGINRVYNTLTNCSFVNDDVKSVSYWPSNQYLNIWLTESMHYGSSMDCVGGGYATFPGGNPLLDGINIRGDLIGSIGTSASNSSWGNFLGRYLIHELGHWFNLRHIWGDATCGTDFVNDTPPAQTSNSGCPFFPHNPSNSCGAGPNGEMFTNYMDYTNGNCLNMFTAGQVARMTTAITSGVSGRNNLWSSTNLAATGTSDPYTYPADCPAVPEMLPYGVKTICVGDSIKFTDISYGGKSDSRLWNFGGGSASSVTDSIVKVAFSTPGTYQVQLTKNYGLNSKNVTYPQKVKVIGNTPHPGFIVPFNDGFDDSTNTMTDWTFIQNGMNDWQWDPSTGMLNTGCMTVNNFAKPAPVVTELISPAYNLSTVYNPTLFFSVSFAGRTTGNYDKLQVFISNNCASTWSQIYSNTASSSLKTVPDDSSPFLPAQGSNEWKVVKQNLNPSLAQGTVRFKFVFTSGGGNNIFLDDINLEGMNTVGLSSSGVLPRLSVFPVPSEDRLTVLLPVSGGASTLQMFDLVGREVKNFEIGSQADDKLEISTGGLTDGMYMLRVNCDGRIFNGSFVKQSAGR